MRDAHSSLRLKVRLCRLIAACCVSALPLRAATVSAVSNLGQPADNLILVGSNNADVQVAISFTTGSSTTELSSVTLNGSGFGGVSTFRVAVYTAISSAGPTGILATLVGLPTPGAAGNHVYSAAAPLVLTPNTTYWLVASAPSAVNPSGFSWRATSSPAEDSGTLAGWSIGNTRLVSTTGGASWVSETNPIPQFSVQVNPLPDAIPIITVQPTPLTPFAGPGVTLVAAAVGNPIPTYQWRKDGVAISGATSGSLTLAGPATHAGSYSVVATNSAGSATSQELLVAPPTFVMHPANQRVVPGTTVTFRASASSNFPTTYQWLKDGAAIPAATGPTLTVSNIQVFSVGSYSVVATNIAGSVTSSTATLSLLLSEAGRLSNLSIRTNAGIDTQALIIGFVLGGAGTSGPKPLLMRGVGPTLGTFGVPGFLADPTLSLLSGTTVVASNDNWAGDAQVTSIGSQVGAFPLSPASSRDAALYSPSLNSGAYTMRVTGVGGTTGVALAEIYDATPAGVFYGNTPRLINVSARTQVGINDNILITGFTVSGNAPLTLLIRAVGPTLGGFGVTGALADPRLDLYSGSTLFQANDNWGGGAAITAASSSVGAFPLAPASRDAALLVTLHPGGYTAQVTGVANTTGVALIEIYELP